MSENERESGKCDNCNGNLERVTDTTAHTYYSHTLMNCANTERDAALERAEKAEADLNALREACEWPERTEMICNYCGMFSSTMQCQPCSMRLSQMYKFVLHEHGIIKALATTPIPTEERTTP